MNKEENRKGIFPPEYYAICSYNFRNKKKQNWFCNKPLSPVESGFHSSQFEENDTSLKCSSDDLMTRSNPSEIESIPSDDFLDSDYVLSNSGTSSEVSSQSFEIFGSPEKSFEKSPMEHTILESAINEGNEVAEEDYDLNKITKNIGSTVSSKKSVFCYYCESIVTNFPRHILRNHSTEVEVMRILSLPTGSKERKNLLFSLRKKGDYLNSNEVIKPVRKGAEKSNYLPCSYCLGFYSSRNLWRHRKQCDKNTDKIENPKNAQADAQNFLIRHLRIDPHLKAHVFPRMRADEISLIAKKDPLICAFASRFLKIKRSADSSLCASRKMRELARLLKEAKIIEPHINNLISALKPQFYDTLVSATKKVAKYDSENQRYQSPTYALQVGTTLKQCCDVALMLASKKSNIIPTVQLANAEVELKTIIQLIEGNWRFDVSSQASNDLSLQKWNKISIVPLASDLKLLKDYLITKANSASLQLEINCLDEKTYSMLLETAYCRSILLNRRRPGELQRLLIQTYQSAFSGQNTQAYEEFSEVISETERVLMKNFKRIVIRGKRGRGVPVLVSKDVQEHLNKILEYRGRIMKKTNNFLFGNFKSSQPIIGYEVLKKHAQLCGAKNPDALTCTRLRKHLATLTQLFNMTENDMEQLASFMGHTLGIHRLSYRLPDDIYQTARISKLLILMEEGEAGQFKGKTLDEINLNLEENLMGTTKYEENEMNEITTPIENELVDLETNLPNEEPTMLPKLQKKRHLERWTEEQKNIVKSYFRKHVTSKKPPKKAECDNLVSKYPKLLKNKSWQKIKVFIQNQYKLN